jgi:hypothetical protein
MGESNFQFVLETWSLDVELKIKLNHQGATSIMIHTFYEVATHLLRYTWEQPFYMV